MPQSPNASQSILSGTLSSVQETPATENPSTIALNNCT
ncbi:hypothetical protein CPTB_01852 [Corynebacterium pseudotuberculosis]|nr:hypothetical protein CPTA_01909 [Corynebacterium pseudotuberculosis]AIG09908.1 hypothetical protein CPTB_01852 [Corynebacterium pseudotuberculosis]AIG12193.1 hypothetical protein CPTC_01905 [Corynebacterium pseudotuberculosis]AKC74093.1 Hypothetical protein Cp226_1379 [Corynebacterium pseudotuberculosis]AQL51450.1 hypothetical protein CpPA04_1354 [Corynebacterium pseudotuberculosis]